MRIKTVVRHDEVRAIGLTWTRRRGGRVVVELSLFWRTVRWVWMPHA